MLDAWCLMRIPCWTYPIPHTTHAKERRHATYPPKPHTRIFQVPQQEQAEHKSLWWDTHHFSQHRQMQSVQVNKNRCSKKWLVPRNLHGLSQDWACPKYMNMGMSRERACPLIIQGLVQLLCKVIALKCNHLLKDHAETCLRTPFCPWAKRRANYPQGRGGNLCYDIDLCSPYWHTDPL